MRETCLTEEVIQRFIDGELSAEQTEAAAAHLAACDRCSTLLGEVEQETSLLMEAFAPEMSLSVPTVRLRERLDAAIAELNPRPNAALASSTPLPSRLRAWFGSLFGANLFRPQHALGFASLAVVLVFAGIFAVIQLRNGREAATPAETVAKVDQPVAQPSVEKITPRPTVENPVAPASTPEVVRASYKPEPRRRPVKPATDKAPQPETPAESSTQPKLLPGERSYLEAIASLSTAIDANKDDVLRPAVRAEYERNLAVVDQAIASTRAQAKRDPNNRDAVEFMYMAYQNKIELLSAVADQTRLASR